MKILYILKRYLIFFENYLLIIFGTVLRLLTIIFILSKIANKIGLEDFRWFNIGISFFASFSDIYAAFFLINSAFLSWIVLSFFDITIFRVLKLNLKSILY